MTVAYGSSLEIEAASTSLYNVLNGRIGMEYCPAIENSLMSDQSEHGNAGGMGRAHGSSFSICLFSFCITSVHQRKTSTRGGGCGWLEWGGRGAIDQ